jgi:hypothetical protein
MEQVVMPGTDVMTCIACKLEFLHNGLMREHYKSDYHRFNLKRKSAGLPSVSQVLFDEKVALAANPKQILKGTKHLKNPEKTEKKKQEKANSAPIEPAADVAIEKTSEELFAEREANAVKLSLEDSLFDDHKSTDLDSNLEYMLGNFSFFIPSIDYLTDLPGLLDYLGQKITVGYTCLYCDKEFYSMKGVRQHMVDKCHCMMQWDYIEEYEDFYKFPKNSTVAQFINEIGELEETKLAYLKPSGELVITSEDGTNKTLGLRQYTPFYKQKNHHYLSHQLTSSLVQEHKRLAVIEYQKKVNSGTVRGQADRARFRKQANIIMHFRDQNGQIL